MAVFDVLPHQAQNGPYFAEMDREMLAGGSAALLADLLDFDLDAEDAPNLRKIPKTEALLEQKLRSLDPVTGWWFERLCDATTTRRSGEWAGYVAVDTLYDDFVNQAEKIGVRRKPDKTAFGMRLSKLVPGIANKKRRSYPHKLPDGSTEYVRQYCYDIPKLAECRALFAEQVGQVVDWPQDYENSETQAAKAGAGDFSRKNGENSDENGF